MIILFSSDEPDSQKNKTTLGTASCTSYLASTQHPFVWQKPLFVLGAFGAFAWVTFGVCVNSCNPGHIFPRAKNTDFNACY